MHEIGAAAGISGPGIYRHFASKEALLGAVLVSISERLLEGGRLRREAARVRAADALDALVAFHADFALDHPELITVQDREFAHLPDEDRQPGAPAAAGLRRDLGRRRCAPPRPACPRTRRAPPSTRRSGCSTRRRTAPRGRRSTGPDLAALLRRVALGALHAAV